MIIKNIGLTAFNRLVERETKLRDESPEHTLDWYTYDNRITLLNEVEKLFLFLPPDPKGLLKDKLPGVNDSDVIKSSPTLISEDKAKPKKTKVVKPVDDSAE